MEESDREMAAISFEVKEKRGELLFFVPDIGIYRDGIFSDELPEGAEVEICKQEQGIVARFRVDKYDNDYRARPFVAMDSGAPTLFNAPKRFFCFSPSLFSFTTNDSLIVLASRDDIRRLKQRLFFEAVFRLVDAKIGLPPWRFAGRVMDDSIARTDSVTRDDMDAYKRQIEKEITNMLPETVAGYVVRGELP